MKRKLLSNSWMTKSVSKLSKNQILCEKKLKKRTKQTKGGHNHFKLLFETTTTKNQKETLLF